MQKFKTALLAFLPAILFFAAACNNTNSKGKVAQMLSASDSSTVSNFSNNTIADSTVNSGETPDSVTPNVNTDSMLSKGLSAMMNKNDSNILKNMGGETNMKSMMQKMQSMMGGKTGNPGDAIGKQLLNLQLGQMSKDNPIKSVANDMMEAQQNGTAGPSKTYTAVYADEQPAGYSVPVSGNGNTIMLQYTGGSIANGKKDGLLKNTYVSTSTANKWNIFSEAYAEQSAINLKAHATSLASVHENYSINTNDQYKKFNKQQRSDAGKNEFNVQVQKIGAEKMFGYNCMHVRVTYTIKGLGQVAHEQDDEWYSNEAPGAQFLSPEIFENHSPAVVKQITDAGCSGVLVKSITTSTNSSQLIQLSKIIKKDIPDSTFILPATYQEDKNTALYNIQ